MSRGSGGSKDAIIVVPCGELMLDKVEEKLGGKTHMMPGSEASEITGRSARYILTPQLLALYTRSNVEFSSRHETG